MKLEHDDHGKATIEQPEGPEAARLFLVPERLIPFLEALRDGPGVYGQTTSHVIESLLINRIEKLWGTPLMPNDLVEEKKHEWEKISPTTGGTDDD